MKILTMVFYSRWEGLDLPHHPVVNFSNPKARATLYDFQGLFIGESAALKFVDKLIEFDDVNHRDIIVEKTAVLPYRSGLAMYHHVRRGSRAIGIYRTIPVKLGTPWAHQCPHDKEHYEFLVTLGWIHR